MSGYDPVKPSAKAMRERLSEAFPLQPLPKNIAERHNPAPDDREYYAVATYFKHRLWTQVDSDDLWRVFPGVPMEWFYFMTTEAFHYYFPSALLTCLEEKNSDFIDLHQGLVYLLTPDSSWAKSRFCDFSADQIALIVEYLQTRKDFLIKKTISGPLFDECLNYWSQFTPKKNDTN